MTNLEEGPRDQFAPWRDDEFLQRVFAKDGWTKRKARFLQLIQSAQDRSEARLRDRGYKLLFQADKDETLLTLAVMYALFWNRQVKHQWEILTRVLDKSGISYSPMPDEKLEVSLEVDQAPPECYLKAARADVRHLHVQYLREKAMINPAKPLEGSTHLDALIKTASIDVYCEAKFLSDISYVTEYATSRNQLARVIDIGLGTGPNFPQKEFAVLLITPRRFMHGESEARSRLYAYKMNEYRSDPSSIQRDLPHRDLTRDQAAWVGSKLGWVSWERLAAIADEAEKRNAVWGSRWLEFLAFMQDRMLAVEPNEQRKIFPAQ